MTRPLATLDTLPDRFWLRVDIQGPDDCWPWVGSLSQKGYGFTYGLRPKLEVTAHRLAYRLFVGLIPANKIVMHACDNRRCVNLAHLSLGTVADNNRDRNNKGRSVNLTGEAHGRCVITDEQVREIRASTQSQRQIAEQYGIAQSHVWRIIHNLSRSEIN